MSLGREDTFFSAELSWLLRPGKRPSVRGWTAGLFVKDCLSSHGICAMICNHSNGNGKRTAGIHNDFDFRETVLN